MNAELVDTLKSTLSKTKVERLAAIAAQDLLVNDLIDLSFDGDKLIGFRAAWILENIYLNHHDRFLPHASYFLKRFCDQSNLSALRHYVKILALMTNGKATLEVKEVLEHCPMDNIIAAVFSWLIDGLTPVAVRAHCLDILANLSTSQVWIKAELIETMDFLVAKKSVGFFSRAKKIRKQLSVKTEI